MRIGVHPRFPHYEVREDGRVFRTVTSKHSKAGDELFGRVLVSGYRQFKLVDSVGQRRLIRANRLVLETLLGPPPTVAHQAAHENNVRLDNALSNLSWKTPKENSADQVRHGTRRTGARMPNASGSAEISARILAETKGAGRLYGVKALAEKYGITEKLVMKIRRGFHWTVSPDGTSNVTSGRSALDQRRMGTQQ